MKRSRRHRNYFRRPIAGLLCVCIIYAQLFRGGFTVVLAQDAPQDAEKKDPVDNAKSTPEAADAPAAGTPKHSKAVEVTKDAKAKDAKSKDGKEKTDEIEVSFQGANIDMIVQWLAQQTGKSVVKHPQVQCQLTIVSSKKVSPREAIDLVYRALALEGFTAIESRKSILIVPEGKEPKISPELVDGSRTDIPIGREKLIKIFPLKFAQAADMKLKVAGLLSEKATVDTDDRANQLIVTDYTENISLVADLIKALDTDKPGDVAVRVIPLKNVSALDLVKDVGALYQKMGAKSQSPKEVVELSANDRSNSLIVMSSEANFKAVQAVVAALDTEDAQEKVMQAFTLKNADATDVAKQLKDLNQDQDNGGSRYPFFFNGGGGGSSKANKKLNVIADRRRNSVIVQAPPAAMDGVAKMITALDEPVTDDALAPVIFPLKYVNAGDIEDVLNELFLKKTQQQRPYWYYEDNPDAGTTPDRDVGRLYGKVRITSEPYSNAIILTSNSKENLDAVIAVLKQLDVPSEAGESTFRVGLRFAKSADVAKSINILFAKNGSPSLRGGTQPQPQPQQNQNQQNQQNQATTTSQPDFDLEQETKEEGYFPWLGGQPDNTRAGADGKSITRPVSDLVGRVRVVSDQRSNSLLISANVHLFPEVMKLIEELDVPTPQVMIEARIVEVSTDYLEALGVRWSPNGAQEFSGTDFDNSFLASGAGNYVKGFGGLTSVTGTNALGTALTSMRSGILSGSINMDLLIQFLKEKTAATVLDQPQMNIADNETGRLFVGQSVPTIDNSSAPAVGGLAQSFKYRDVGVKLEVTPHINVTGEISLKIHVESSTLVPGVTILGGVVINSRNFKTDLSARNGQTLVLGGIIQKQLSDISRKTPGLGSIPGLKWLFNKKNKTSNEVELMVFLRPKVVRSPEEAKELLDETDKKAPLVKQWQEGTLLPDPEKKKAKKKED